MAEARQGASIALWDSAAEPTACDGLVYRWNGYAETGSQRSLLRYVDEHGQRLRAEYLAWVHEAGEAEVGGARVVDQIAIDGQLSYWWMTLLAEHSPWKSPAIVDALRVMALEDILKAARPREFVLFTGNANLHESVRATCEGLGIAFRWQRLAGAKRSFRPRALYERSPHAIRAALVLLRQLKLIWPLRAADKKGFSRGKSGRLFVSYFIHLDRAACSEGKFTSGHWGALPEHLAQWGVSANWMQHYLESRVVPSTGIALDWVAKFNQRRATEGFHTFVDGFIGWGGVSRVVRGWFRLQRQARNLRGIERAFVPKHRKVSLWPLLRDDWSSSMRGVVSVLNLTWLEQFDQALGSLQKQPQGFYLYENQSWERALIRAWRKHGHGDLVAVSHSTIRFWDLRYFNDRRTVASTATHAMPQADRIAVNGPEAVRALGDFAPIDDRIVECEALRYDYLRSIRPRDSSRRDGDDIKLLVLGDFDAAVTGEMLRLLEAAAGLGSVRVTCGMKSHPNFTVDVADYPSLRLTPIDTSLANVLGGWDVAFSSNTSSASVDAMLAGLPVAVMLDGATLNYSPLRGRAGVRFVSTAAELAGALRTLTAEPGPVADARTFFHLDPELPRWRRLLTVPR